ncbi:MAG TPA: RNA polymerase sigma factor [Anaerolineales bacterium]|nr:RNA polymerase sigma factor [Anaerolineales bacterium]
MSTFQRAKTAQISTASKIDWAAAYEELLPKVYHYFCLQVGDRLEAEDLTAATFERAWRDRERYQKDLGTFTNWLFGIARHVTITHFRQNKHEQVRTEPENPEVSRPTEESAARQEEFQRLASLLTALPAREREIFSLKYGAQFTNRSIAKIVGVTESNVGTILHRLVSRLKEQWEHENER